MLFSLSVVDSSYNYAMLPKPKTDFLIAIEHSILISVVDVVISPMNPY